MSQHQPICLHIQNATIHVGQPTPPQFASISFVGMDLSAQADANAGDAAARVQGNGQATPQTPTAEAAGVELQWSPTLADGDRVNFAGAEAAIAKLNEGLAAGEPQWRMPSRRELESIQDLTKHNPCVDLEKYPDTKSGYYWSATPCAWSSVRAWCVGFGDGDSYDSHRDYDFAFVRAVRAVPSGQ